MKEPKYLTPRKMFDPAIISEGFHIVYDYSKLLKILVDDYTLQILETKSFQSASLSAIEVEANRRARAWIAWLSESAFYNHYRAPLITRTCSECNTPIKGEIGLCPATQYKNNCVLTACTL
jgi:hypothetical protein